MTALGAGHDRLLAGDRGQVADRGVERLRVRDRLAEADVHDDLLETRDLHRVRVAELAAQGRRDVVVVALAQAVYTGGANVPSARAAVRVGAAAADVLAQRRPSSCDGWLRRGLASAFGSARLGFVSGLTRAHLHLLAALLADPDPAPVLELRMTDAGRLVAARTDDQDVADVQRHRQIEDPAGLRALPRALMLRGHVDARDHDPEPALRALDPVDGAPLAAVLAGQHDDGVALANVRHVRGPPGRARRSSCSCARAARGRPARRCACRAGCPAG